MLKYPYSLVNNLKYLKSLLNTSSPTIFEIGCNDGTDTQRFLDLFPGVQLHCFEPEPRAIKQFKTSIKDDRVKLYEIAIGKGNETNHRFYQSSGTQKDAYKADWDLSGSLNKPTGHLEYSPWVKFDTEISVEVQSLDFVVNQHLCLDVVDLMWIDVQGGESNVLAGAQKTLEITRYVYAEFGHWKEPLYEGQMTLDETIETLGEGWKPLSTYENCNLLAANRRYEK